jgi:hypothetical protein
LASALSAAVSVRAYRRGARASNVSVERIDL